MLFFRSPIKLRADQFDDTSCLMILNPKDDIIEIFPQDWFNNGPYDTMWQGPILAARDPKSNDIIGDGIRLDTFILDKLYREIKAWLK